MRKRVLLIFCLELLLNLCSPFAIALAQARQTPPQEGKPATGQEKKVSPPPIPIPPSITALNYLLDLSQLKLRLGKLEEVRELRIITKSDTEPERVVAKPDDRFVIVTLEGTAPRDCYPVVRLADFSAFLIASEDTYPRVFNAVALMIVGNDLPQGWRGAPDYQLMFRKAASEPVIIKFAVRLPKKKGRLIVRYPTIAVKQGEV
jgi:hypothetical protein